MGARASHQTPTRHGQCRMFLPERLAIGSKPLIRWPLFKAGSFCAAKHSATIVIWFGLANSRNCEGKQ